MSLENMSTNAGMKKNTHSRDMTTPFASTMPISKPIVNCMNMSATSPATVVRLLAETGAKVLASAVVIASRSSSPLPISSSKRWSRIME